MRGANCFDRWTQSALICQSALHSHLRRSAIRRVLSRTRARAHAHRSMGKVAQDPLDVGDDERSRAAEMRGGLLQSA